MASAIESQYRKWDTLRRAVRNGSCTHLPEKHLDNFKNRRPQGCNVVDCLEESHASWKQSKEFKNGIKRIRQWKNQPEGHVDSQSAEDTDMDPGRAIVRRIIEQTRENAFDEDMHDMHPGEYELERDVNGYVIQWEIVGHGEDGDGSESEHELTESYSCRPKHLTGQLSTPTILRSEFMEGQELSDSLRESLRDLGGQRSRRPKMVAQQPFNLFRRSGHEMYLRPVEENVTVDRRFKDHFPYQRVSLHDLLGDRSSQSKDDIILRKSRNSDRVRYIHIPYNNMEVSCSCSNLATSHLTMFD